MEADCEAYGDWTDHDDPRIQSAKWSGRTQDQGTKDGSKDSHQPTTNNRLVSLPQLASYANAAYSETIDMWPYKAVYGRDYPLLSTYQTSATAVLATANYYNRDNELPNWANQACKLFRVRSTTTVTKRRTPHTPVPVGGQVLVLKDMFSTESGWSMKLDTCWHGPCTVLNYEDVTQNSIVEAAGQDVRPEASSIPLVSSQFLQGKRR